MRRPCVWLGLLGLLATACGGGSSSLPREHLLLAFTLEDDGGTLLPGISWYAAALGVESSPGSGRYPEVFEDYILTPDWEGTTILSPEGDDVEFPELARLLTNGIDDTLRVRLDRDTGPAQWSERPESSYALAGPQRFGPDLVGYAITRFELHVVELRFESPGRDPNGDGDWQDRFVELRIEVYGVR